MTEAERGNRVALAVWQWLGQEQALERVPWAPNADSPDADKAARRQARAELLVGLEATITQAAGE